MAVLARCDASGDHDAVRVLDKIHDHHVAAVLEQRAALEPVDGSRR
jgi:hypothetical protein